MIWQFPTLQGSSLLLELEIAGDIAGDIAGGRVNQSGTARFNAKYAHTL